MKVSLLLLAMVVSAGCGILSKETYYQSDNVSKSWNTLGPTNTTIKNNDINMDIEVRPQDWLAKIY